jgi:hypothetical protein
MGRKNENALVCPFRRHCTEDCMLYDDENNVCVFFYLKWLVEGMDRMMEGKVIESIKRR